MSDSHEPSYYEIALTNRQVLIAFVILLVCLVAAFLSGVWVGRGDLPTGPGRVAEGAAPVDEPGASAVESLSFFGGDEGDGPKTVPRPAPSAAAAKPRADTTLAEDLGAETAPPARQEPARTEPARSEPARTEAAPPPAPAARTPPASAPGSGGDLMVQVFSSRDRDQALKVVNRLQGGGRDAYLSPVEVDGEPMYRVRLGPFSDRGQAETVSEQIRREFRLDTWITAR